MRPSRAATHVCRHSAEATTQTDREAGAAKTVWLPPALCLITHLSSRAACAFGVSRPQVAALGPANWGVDGNYELNPPVGFWPDYVTGIADAIAAKYGLGRLQVNRTFYSSSSQVLDAVRTRRHHLTEPYFNLGAFYRGVPRRVGMRASCSVLGYDSTFFVNSSAGVASAAALASAINGRKVGALSEGDWQAVAPVLPQGTPFQVFGSAGSLEQAVSGGTVFAGVISGDPNATAGFSSFSSQVVTLRSFLLPAQPMPTPCPSPAASSAHEPRASGATMAVLSAFGMLGFVNRRREGQ